jgi:hypothetical protein
MKNKSRPSIHYSPSIGGLLLGLALFLCASANAQNLLKNGNFESPFPVSDPTAGWQLVFWANRGGPADFAIAGQTTEASAGGGGRGAHFRACHPGPAWAYFKQVVTNLTEGAHYTLSCQKMKVIDVNHLSLLTIYMAAISGSSSNAVEGTAADIPYSLSITCGASRQIEVQLQYNLKMIATGDSADDYKSSETGAHFDEFSLTLTP